MLGYVIRSLHYEFGYVKQRIKNSRNITNLPTIFKFCTKSIRRTSPPPKPKEGILNSAEASKSLFCKKGKFGRGQICLFCFSGLDSLTILDIFKILEDWKTVCYSMACASKTKDGMGRIGRIFYFSFYFFWLQGISA